MKDTIEIAKEILDLISPEQAWRYRVLPKSIDNNTFVLYSDIIDDLDKNNSLEILFDKHIIIEELSADVLNKSIGRYYRRSQAGAESIGQISSNTTNIINKIIREAKSLGSSDIHIEYYENSARVRYRIDGKLIHRFSIDKSDYKLLTNQIKLQAGANLAEVRLPQDGRLDIRNADFNIDIRASILPVYGSHEKVVLRLLGNDLGDIGIKDLGFDAKQLNDYTDSVKKPTGIVLISGPTGSGKTTTLYSTLRELNDDSVNIMTVENPIEYVLEGVNQVQLNESIGLTFANTLKSFLRQDPDIIMLGEIRDKETAEIAVRASLTGHLVLSTIHTNSAWGTISRLVDMDIPPYLLADTLNVSVAQRLVRVLCENCKIKTEFSTKDLPNSYQPVPDIDYVYSPCGCENCHYTGFKGRTAIYEVLRIDDDLASKIKSSSFADSKILGEKGISSLQQSAINLLKEGKTSIKEIYPILLTY